MIIYKTTNLIDGKFYIGKDEKNKKSYYGSGTYFKNALKKYGKENFRKDILEFCTDREHLCEREKFWIALTKAKELGYNIANGGEGTSGRKLSDETKRKISESLKGHKVSDETKRKIRESNTGHIVSKETKEKISSAQKNMSDETKERISLGRKEYFRNGGIHPSLGKKYSTEHKRNISESNKKTYKLNGSPLKNKPLTEEHKKKISKANKGRIFSKETKEKISKANSGRKLSDETKRKISESLKRKKRG